MAEAAFRPHLSLKWGLWCYGVSQHCSMGKARRFFFEFFCIRLSSLMTQTLVEWLITSRYHWYQYGMWLMKCRPIVTNSSKCRKTADRATFGHVHQPWQGLVVTFLKVILSRKRYLFGSFPGSRKKHLICRKFWTSIVLNKFHGFECWPKFFTQCVKRLLGKT